MLGSVDGHLLAYKMRGPPDLASPSKGRRLPLVVREVARAVDPSAGHEVDVLMAVHSGLKEKMTVSKMQGFEVPEVSAVQASQSLIPNLHESLQLENLPQSPQRSNAAAAQPAAAAPQHAPAPARRIPLRYCR